MKLSLTKLKTLRWMANADARLLKGQVVSTEKPVRPAVFMFTGQGSQYVGMGKDLAQEWKVARDVFEEVDDSLRITLSRLMFDGPSSDLQATEIAQPAILAHGLAVLAVLEVRQLGVFVLIKQRKSIN